MFKKEVNSKTHYNVACVHEQNDIDNGYLFDAPLFSNSKVLMTKF